MPVSERQKERLGWAFFWLVMVCYAVVILRATMPPPFVDYPDWVYQGRLFEGVLMGHPVAHYVLKSYPVPNSLTTVGLGLLDGVLGWRLAGKVWICIYLGLAGFATRAGWSAATKMGSRPNWKFLVAMPGVIFVNLNFWYGHINFELGMCLVMVLLAMLVRESASWAVAAMLVMIFFAHMEACAAAMLLVLAWNFERMAWRRMAVLIPALLLTAWYAAGRFAGRHGQVLQADFGYGSKRFLIYKANTFLKTFGYVQATDGGGRSISEALLGRGLFAVMLGASILLAALCLWACGRAAWKTQGALRLVIFLLAGLALVLPQVWLGVADPGSRLLLMAAALGMPLVAWRSRQGSTIACLSVLFCVMNLWQFAAVEANPRREGRVGDLPGWMMTYGHVGPATRVGYYDALAGDDMTETIFETAMFEETGRSGK